MKKIILFIGIVMILISGCDIYHKIYDQYTLGVCNKPLDIIDLCQLELNKSISDASYGENNIIGCCWHIILYDEERGYYTEKKCKGILNKHLTGEIHNVTEYWCFPNEWEEYK